MSKEEEILNAIQRLEKTVNNNNVRTQRIERKLIGDKQMEIPGLISEVEDLKKFKRKEELNKAKQKGIIAGISFAFGALGTWLKQQIGS